ncbi:hypothetical protein GCM10027261_19010 [Geodermatophilus arenarius]
MDLDPAAPVGAPTPIPHGAGTEPEIKFGEVPAPPPSRSGGASPRLGTTIRSLGMTPPIHGTSAPAVGSVIRAASLVAKWRL